MFEDDDFELDDDDFISSSFTKTQPKSPAVATSQVECFKPIIQVSESKQNPFKKPDVSLSKAPSLLRQSQKIQQRQKLSIRQLASKETFNSNVLDSESVPSEEPNKSALESTDKSDKAMKRKFPGPAGILSDHNCDIFNQEHLELKKTKNKYSENNHEVLFKPTSIFDDGPWMEMVHDYRACHPASVFLPDKFNIQWIKCNANLTRFIDKKVPFLAAFVQNIQANSTLTSINLTLKDTTGEICAAILHTLFREYSEDLTVGSVIVLRQFSVFTTGINKHHITIAPNNLITIYSKHTGKNSTYNGHRNKKIPSPISSTNVSVKKTVVQKVTSEELIKQVDQVVLPLQESGNLISKYQTAESGNIGSDQSLNSPKRKILSLNHDRNDFVEVSSVNASTDRLVTSRSLGLNGLIKTGSSFTHTQKEVVENTDLLCVDKIENCFENISNNSNIGNLKEKEKKLDFHQFSTNDVTDTFKSKRAQNIFDIDDDLNLTLGEEFNADMDFDMKEIIKTNRVGHEKNKFQPHSSKIELDIINCDEKHTEEVVPLKVCTLTNEADTNPKEVKIRAALQKFKYKPRNCDEKEVEFQKSEISKPPLNREEVPLKRPLNKKELGGKPPLNKDERVVLKQSVNKEKEALSKPPSNKEDSQQIAINSVKDLTITNSQLSVKTTNAEHNNIWKNLFEDIDTESLFDDF